jgi:PleD family two-component response regulator
MTSRLVTGIKVGRTRSFKPELSSKIQEKALLMSKSCLIAAHDPWLIQLLRVFAHGSGFDVIQALEGQEVLPLAREALPIVILLQMDLAGQLRGWEVPQELKSTPDTQQIPILIFSWTGQNLNEIPENDTVTFIQEPVTYESFVNALNKLGIACPEKTGTMEFPRL